MGNISQINGRLITAQSASFATTAQTLLGSVQSASFAATASYAVTASYALNSVGTSVTNVGTVIAVTQIMYPFTGF